MHLSTRDVLDRLAAHAEAVCAYYLPAGRREGRYWLVGDVDNTPGRSLFVGLDSGKWLDAESGQHGDLLDIIGHRASCSSFPEALDEARRFLSLPIPAPAPPWQPARSGSAGRLFTLTRTIDGTLGLRYLRARAITAHPGAAVRFHPRCFVRTHPGAATQTFPAIVAAMTDTAGALKAVHRIWLRHDGQAQADFPEPKRSLGDALGAAIRIGRPSEALVAGEGLENVLSVCSILPGLPGAAATSAAHLGAFVIPPGIRRLYVAHDGDAAADGAFDRLSTTARRIGIEAIALHSPIGDLNQGLRVLGSDSLLAAVAEQLAPLDRQRFTVLGQPEKGRGSVRASAPPAPLPAESRAAAF